MYSISRDGQRYRSLSLSHSLFFLLRRFSIKLYIRKHASIGIVEDTVEPGLFLFYTGYKNLGRNIGRGEGSSLYASHCRRIRVGAFPLFSSQGRSELPRIRFATMTSYFVSSLSLSLFPLSISATRRDAPRKEAIQRLLISHNSKRNDGTGFCVTRTIRISSNAPNEIASRLMIHRETSSDAVLRKRNEIFARR